MADDDTASETVSAIKDLKEWLNSSLCGCPVKNPEGLKSENDGKEVAAEKADGVAEISVELDPDAWNKIWVDGRIFHWLVHSFRPDITSAPSIAVSEEGTSKLQQAFKVAQEEYGVQNLMLISDFASGVDAEKKLDSLIVLTYLAQFKHALRNVEPVCLNSRSQIQFHWPFTAEESIYLRPIIESPKCHDCHETVLILDRFLLPSTNTSSGTDVRHRRCFRCERCKKLLRIGLYRPTKSGVGYECLDHEKEDLMVRAAAALDTKPKLTEAEPIVDAKNSEEKAKIYPELPKVDEGTLYPRLASPEKKILDSSVDSGVASSSPDLSTQQTSTGNLGDQLAPPVPSRSRSSERDIPVPIPRKSLHTRVGSDIPAGTVSSSAENVSASNSNREAVSATGKPGRPQRPAIPPKPKPEPSPVPLRHDYPEELNPFGDPVETENRHSTPVISNVDKSNIDNRRSVAIGATTKGAASSKPKKLDNSEKSLNPFGSESESEDEEKTGGHDDASSLSSTNPFNDSADESDSKENPFSEDAKGNEKKLLPPPRPPPPSKATPGPLSSTPKLAHKKRPAPPPPPPPPQPTTQPQTLAPGGPPPRPASPKKHRKKRPAPPRPLPLKRQIRTESALSPEHLSIAFEDNENHLLEVEAAGGKFETNLRQSADEKGLAKVSDNDIRDWIDFIHRKFDLIRKETELVYICRERQLDELHAEIEYQLRCIIEKPESEKTSEDMDREAVLLQRMLDVIEEKSKLIDSQDDMHVQAGTMPRNSIQLDDSSQSGNVSKSSTLDKSSQSGKTTEEKQEKKKKKIKSRLKKLKQKIASSTLLHHS